MGTRLLCIYCGRKVMSIHHSVYHKDCHRKHLAEVRAQDTCGDTREFRDALEVAIQKVHTSLSTTVTHWHQDEGEAALLEKFPDFKGRVGPLPL